MRSPSVRKGIWLKTTSMSVPQCPFVFSPSIPGEGNGPPPQYSCLENPMDGGAWKAVVHGVTEGRTWLSDFTFTFHFHALEKEMATHSSVLAWRIPGNAEPGGLPSTGSHRVGHDWSDLAASIPTCWNDHGKKNSSISNILIWVTNTSTPVALLLILTVSLCPWDFPGKNTGVGCHCLLHVILRKS